MSQQGNLLKSSHYCPLHLCRLEWWMMGFPLICVHVPYLHLDHWADHGTHTSPTADNSGASDPTGRPAEEHPPPLPPRLMDDGASTPPLLESVDQSIPQCTCRNYHYTKCCESTCCYWEGILWRHPKIPEQAGMVFHTSADGYVTVMWHPAWIFIGHFFPIGPALCLITIEGHFQEGAVDDLHQVVYTEVKPHSIPQTGDQNINCTFLTRQVTQLHIQVLTTFTLLLIFIPYTMSCVSPPM